MLNMEEGIKLIIILNLLNNNKLANLSFIYIKDKFVYNLLYEKERTIKTNN